jgi:hypothetical protein
VQVGLAGHLGVDGAFRQLGGMETCVKQMADWQRNGGRRQLRIYHSEDTVDSSTSTKLLNERAPAVAIKRFTGKAGFVDEGYSSDRSLFWALFSNPTLTTKSPTDEAALVWPPLGSQDAHHMVPTVAFGHAYIV